MLRETKTKRKKFRIRWSKGPRVLEPLNRVMAVLVTRLAIQPKNTKNGAISRGYESPGWPRPFPAEKHPKWQEIAISRGYVHFQQILRRTKTKSKKFRIRWSKVPRVLEPLKSSYGHFSHPAGHGRFKPKNTQNGNKSQFPGATCIFSKCCERQKRRARNSASDGQKYRAFWSSLKADDSKWPF